VGKRIEQGKEVAAVESVKVANALNAPMSGEVKLVDLSSGAQRGVDHLALNPAGKVPVLVEKEEDREPFILTQSNAIILYAAGKAAGRLLPENDRDRAIVFERFFFFVTDVIVVSHAAFSLRASRAQEAEMILMDRVLATLVTAERYVGHNEFIAGETFSAADIAAFTITQLVESDLPWPKLPNLRGWFERIEARPSAKRGLQVFNRI
jgi:GSH-dependent disulfide-bond oxidoreductase